MTAPTPVKNRPRAVRFALKRKYSDIGLQEAMQLVGRENVLLWQLDTPDRPASAFLEEDLRRLQVFDLTASEQGKTLLIDSLLSEIVPNHDELKIWKAAALQTDTLTGVADYVIAPRRAYLATPLLCVIKAKRDDFEKGRAQCIAEMYACQWNNRQSKTNTDVFGIVSNGQAWQFYKLTGDGDVWETELYALRELSGLLGALDYVCGECAKLISVPSH
ncbi:MAG: hypothetical protein H8F28_04545 [Fibrella sp.]|nr:hypothetical protein [Armatimonadota bacterium]